MLMEYVIAIFAYCLVLYLCYVIRKSMKVYNAHYSLFDDVLLWGGAPIALGYFMYTSFNPENHTEFIYREIYEKLYAWLFISGFLFLWRNRPFRCDKTNWETCYSQ